jgi:hypothetical protein
MDISATTPILQRSILPDVRPFSCVVGQKSISGTVTYYTPLVSPDTHGVYTVEALVGYTQYKFAINRTGSVWSTGIVSVYDHGKIESLDAFILSHPKIEELFEQALTTLTTYRNHGVAGIDSTQPIDTTRPPN